MKSFLKRLYYTYLNKHTLKTVHVRGRLSPLDEQLFQSARGKFLVNEIYKNNDLQKTILEIGFGNGQHLVQLAQENVDKKVCGVELYKAGIVKVLKEIEQKNLENLKIIYKDARQVVADLSKESTSEMYILFPDPWPKKKHHKRRLLQKSFIKDCVERLNKDGVLYIATDWENYAEEIEKSLMELQLQKTLTYTKVLNTPETERILKTTFAKRAEKEGREIAIFRIIRN